MYGGVTQLHLTSELFVLSSSPTDTRKFPKVQASLSLGLLLPVTTTSSFAGSAKKLPLCYMYQIHLKHKITLTTTPINGTACIVTVINGNTTFV